MKSLRLLTFFVLMVIVSSACAPRPSCNQPVFLPDGKSVQLDSWTETDEYPAGPNSHAFPDDSGVYELTTNNDGTITMVMSCELDSKNYISIYNPTNLSGQP